MTDPGNNNAASFSEKLKAISNLPTDREKIKQLVQCMEELHTQLQTYNDTISSLLATIGSQQQHLGSLDQHLAAHDRHLAVHDQQLLPKEE